MGNLVIETRVAVTKRNLRRIEELNETLSTRANELHNFLELPRGWLEELDDIHRNSRKLLTKARRYKLQSGDADQEPHLYIEDLRKGINDLDRRIDRLYERVGPTADDAIRLRRELLQFREFENMSRDVRDHLIKQAQETKASLTVKNYFTERDRIEGFFAEYVDLLRAIALRSAGFTEKDSQLSDIFRIADKMPGLCGTVEGWEWTSLVVPSYQELNRKSQAMMLRLGFPEWTLWALPFIQNEFAHVYLEKRQGLAAGWECPHRVTLLADALAALVTGPAYACAALMLRLDPAAVTEPSSIMALRSATIIYSLDRVSAGDDPTLRTLTSRLRTEWRDAIAVADGDPLAFDEAMKNPEIDTAVQRALAAVPDRDVSGRPAWASRWATIAKWSELLRQDKAAKIDPQQADKRHRLIALTFLLNAAWLARVQNASEADDEDASESRLDVIAAGAIRRMLQVIATSTNRPAAGRSAHPRPHPR